MCSPLIDGDPPFHKDVGKGLTKPEEVAPFVEEMKHGRDDAEDVRRLHAGNRAAGN